MSGLLRDSWFDRLASGRRAAADRRRRAREAGVTVEEVDAADAAARALLWMNHPGAPSAVAALRLFDASVRAAVAALRGLGNAFSAVATAFREEPPGSPDPVPSLLSALGRGTPRGERPARRPRGLPPRPPPGCGRERRPPPFRSPRGVRCGRR